jgi:hypothetical protein
VDGPLNPETSPPEACTYLQTSKHRRRNRGRTSKPQNITAETVDALPNLETSPPEPWTNLQSSKHSRRRRGPISMPLLLFYDKKRYFQWRKTDEGLAENLTMKSKTQMIASYYNIIGVKGKLTTRLKHNI